MKSDIDRPGSQCWHCESTEHDTAGHDHSKDYRGRAASPSESGEKPERVDTGVSKEELGEAVEDYMDAVRCWMVPETARGGKDVQAAEDRVRRILAQGSKR